MAEAARLFSLRTLGIYCSVVHLFGAAQAFSSPRFSFQRRCVWYYLLISIYLLSSATQPNPTRSCTTKLPLHCIATRVELLMFHQRQQGGNRLSAFKRQHCSTRILSRVTTGVHTCRVCVSRKERSGRAETNRRVFYIKSG